MIEIYAQAYKEVSQKLIDKMLKGEIAGAILCCRSADPTARNVSDRM
jgi:hypothetical protein